MATTMKGLLKGLRYITQIFDEEEEPEMQIGLPTDVKHVAHIGSNGPTWMDEYKPPELAKEPERDGMNQGTKFNPEGTNQAGSAGLKQLLPANQSETPKHKTRRKPGTLGSESPTKKGSSTDEPPKQSRRHRGSHNSMDSSSHHRDPSSQRRHHNWVSDMDLTDQGDATPPRKPTSRHRKSKNSIGRDSSVEGSKSKDENSSSLMGTS